MLLTDAIKDSMINPLDMQSLNGLMKHVNTRYISDMNIILSAMRPIYNIVATMGDVRAIKN